MIFTMPAEINRFSELSHPFTINTIVIDYRDITENEIKTLLARYWNIYLKNLQENMNLLMRSLAQKLDGTKVNDQYKELEKLYEKAINIIQDDPKSIVEHFESKASLWPQTLFGLNYELYTQCDDNCTATEVSVQTNDTEIEEYKKEIEELKKQIEVLKHKEKYDPVAFRNNSQQCTSIKQKSNFIIYRGINYPCLFVPNLSEKERILFINAMFERYRQEYDLEKIDDLAKFDTLKGRLMEGTYVLMRRDRNLTQQVLNTIVEEIRQKLLYNSD